MGLYPTDRYIIRIEPSQDYAKNHPFTQKEVKGAKETSDLVKKLSDEGYHVNLNNLVLFSYDMSYVEQPCFFPSESKRDTA